MSRSTWRLRKWARAARVVCGEAVRTVVRCRLEVTSYRPVIVEVGHVLEPCNARLERTGYRS